MRNRLTWFGTAGIIIFWCCVFLPSMGPGGEVFATWEGFEVDKLASIWLIQRHISPGAAIVFYPKGEPIPKGIPFDVPDAAIKRSFNQSAFASLLIQHGIRDPRLDKLALLVHDIEINTWERKVFRKSSEMEVLFIDLINTHPDKEELIRESNAFFDAFYQEELSGELERNLQ